MRRAIRRLRTFVASYPEIYLPLARRAKGDWVVSPRTDIVIEGYPRSGNSFAEAAFRIANRGRNLVIGHHTHAAAQLIGAARFGVPAVVVIREPIESCRSLLMMDRTVFSARAVLHEYRQFHRGIATVREHLVLASFEAVTTDFGAVTDVINAKFGTRFARFEHTEANSRAAFAYLDTLSRERGTAGEDGEPYSIGQSDEFRARRERDKQRVRAELAVAALAPLREEVEALYARLRADCDI